jgi:hypothetical protein
MKNIKESFPNEGHLFPLDNTEVSALMSSEDKPLGIESKFYLIAIPSIFKDNGLLSSTYHAY